MSTTVDATFDGSVFRPIGDVPLSPNTPVRLTVEKLPVASARTGSFLQAARDLHLQGPPDWATNLDAYLYGKEPESGS